MSHKFKIGERVRVKTLEEISKDYRIYEDEGVIIEDNPTFVDDMLMFCGKIWRITRMTANNQPLLYSHYHNRPFEFKRDWVELVSGGINEILMEIKK